MFTSISMLSRLPQFLPIVAGYAPLLLETNIHPLCECLRIMFEVVACTLSVHRLASSAELNACAMLYLVDS